MSVTTRESSGAAPDGGVRPAGAAGVAISGLRHAYGELRTIDGLDLAAAPGEVLGLVGPSGCGKSTLLELVCGLREPTAGTVAVGGEATAPERLARCAFMPQRDLLLPWYSALDNAALALRNRGAGKRDARESAAALFQRFGLAGFERSRPDELSGGMRQRVAIARTLAMEPAILLMDEPFGALDEQTRLLLGEKVLQIQQTLQQTTLLITHSIGEAVQLSDRIVVMTYRPGRVKRIVSVPLPRPRSAAILSSEAFGRCVAEIWADLREEASRGMAETEHLDLAAPERSNASA